MLGAQAPKSVRSQKMDDVIFAGTAKRPALGRAEVSITIDNSDGTLGVDLSEITVTRILFRNGDSEYSINGVPCRLLDVQELLSDAGVGRQQHVIVSQGQIDAVLNARPEERRAIIEEAAGVLKFRKRKEKAERRLDATEANLLRVQDLLREVRRQLRPLERQAAAAERHGSLITELNHAQDVRRRPRDRVVAGEARSARRRRASRAPPAESELKSSLAGLDTAVMAIEAELSARGQSDTGDRLVRVEQLRERARGLAAVLAERRRSLERDRGQLLDADLVANLEAEAVTVPRGTRAVVAATSSRVEPAADELVADEARFDERAVDGARGGRAERSDRTLARRARRPRSVASCARCARRFDRSLDEVRRHEGRSSVARPSGSRRCDEAAERFRGECDAAGSVEAIARRRGRGRRGCARRRGRRAHRGPAVAARRRRRAAASTLRRGSRRSSSHSTPLGPGPAPNGSPASTVCSARCST